MEARRAEGAIRRRAVREERCDDRKAPGEAKTVCPGGGSGEAAGVKSGNDAKSSW